jgi:hypothetical protein
MRFGNKRGVAFGTILTIRKDGPCPRSLDAEARRFTHGLRFESAALIS